MHPLVNGPKSLKRGALDSYLEIRALAATRPLYQDSELHDLDSDAQSPSRGRLLHLWIPPDILPSISASPTCRRPAARKGRRQKKKKRDQTLELLKQP